MNRWILPFGLRREQPKTRRSRETVKPQLEELKERILPSTTPSQQMTETAMQMVTTMMKQRFQLIVTVEQDFVNNLDAYTQKVAQLMSSAVQQVEHDLGIVPPNAGSGSGSGSGTITPTNNAPNQQPIPIKPQSGSGTGSGAITSHENPPKQRFTPLAADGSGSGSQFGSSDTLEWSPQGGSYNAGSPGNWIDLSKNGKRLGDPTATNPVIFDGSNNTLNQPINWTTGGNVGSMELQHGYNKLMTIASPWGVIDSGTFVEDDASKLYVSFGKDSTFQINGGGVITNMTLAGDPTGTFILAGGTTSIGEFGAYRDLIGVNFTVLPGARLEDAGQSTLQFSNTYLVFDIQGTVNLSTNHSGPNLISGVANDYIKVEDGGLLYYTGQEATDTDTIALPIYLLNGTLQVTAAAGYGSAGKLIVQDGSDYVFSNVPPAGSKESVYLEGSYASVNLSNGATLQCTDGYYQADGTLFTGDNTKCTLIDGSGRTTTIAGGSVIVDTAGNSYGELDVQTGTLDFSGQLQVAVQGYSQNPPPNPNVGTSDLLKVIGILNLNQPASSLYVIGNGQLDGGDTWIIITSSNITSNANPIGSGFGSISDNNPGISYNGWPNNPKPGSYKLTI